MDKERISIRANPEKHHTAVNELRKHGLIHSWWYDKKLDGVISGDDPLISKKVLFGGAVVAVIGFSLFKGFSATHEIKVSCADFKSQQEAEESFKNGAIWLDRDNDGKPCEWLPKLSTDNHLTSIK